MKRRLSRFAGDRPFIAIEPLSPADGAAILDGWLAEPQPDPLLGNVSRTLTDTQRGDLLAKFSTAGGLPIYLKVAYEQARRWRCYDGLPALSDGEPGLAADAVGVIQDLFWGLERPENHGQVFVAHALGYLAAARHGLSEDELLDVLSADAEVMDEFRRRSPGSPRSDRLPVVVWSRLYHDLEPYLAERQAPGGLAVLGFYHRQVAEAAALRYCAGGEAIARHRGLAAYFSGQPTWLDARGGRANVRKAAELAYQQTRGALWPELTATLTDFDFLEAAVRGLSVYALEADYRDALAAWGGAATRPQPRGSLRGAPAAGEPPLSRRAPELLFPQLYNHLTWLDAPDGPLHTLCERGRQGPRRLAADGAGPAPCAPTMGDVPGRAHGAGDTPWR